MREISIMREVERICRDVIRVGFNPRTPWKALDQYNEGTTEEEYRLRRLRKIDSLQKQMLSNHKATKTPLNRYKNQIYIIRRPKGNKNFDRIQHWRCKEKIDKRIPIDIKRMHRNEKARLKEIADYDFPQS